MGKPLTQEYVESQIKAKFPHLDTSKMVYIDIKTKIELYCEIHKHTFFKQYSNLQYNKYGCHICEQENKNKPQKLTTEEFITIARSKNSVLDFSKVEYINYNSHVTVICPEHGEYQQVPSTFLERRTKNVIGCPKCKHRVVRDVKRKDINTLKDEMNIIHNKKYTYPFETFTNNRCKVDICCPTHGIFKQRITVHLTGSGCPKCSSSKGELSILNFLKDNGIQFETEHYFDDCKHLKHLYFDFYIPSINYIIEYDGIQHFKPVKHFGGDSYFKKIQIRDKIKNEYCSTNNIHLLRISHTDNILDVLTQWKNSYL